MNQSAGFMLDASGGVTRKGKNRRSETCAGRCVVGTKAVNRRKLLMVFYPLWVVGFAMLFLGLIIAEWWEDL